MPHQVLAEIATARRPAPARFRAGQTVRVHTKVVEGSKTRIQTYEGVVIDVSGSGPSRTITVRKISFNKIGVERTFPLFSPLIDRIEIVDQARVRRANISFVRDARARKLRGKKPVGQEWSGAEIAEEEPAPETSVEAPAEAETPAEAPAEEAKDEAPAEATPEKSEEPEESAPAKEVKEEAKEEKKD